MSIRRFVLVTAQAPPPALHARGWGVRVLHGPPIDTSSWHAVVCESADGCDDNVAALLSAFADKGLPAPFEVPSPLLSGPALVVTDVDSTLIMEEVIEELAERAGTRREVAQITARAMNGECDFAESLRARVKTLAGLSESVFSEVLDSIRPTLGAQLLVDSIHALGGYFAVVSGGFEEVVAPLCARMGIDHFVANRLEVVAGALTGRVLGEIVTAETKVSRMQHWAQQHDADLSHVIAVGDGANDIPMLNTAGLGIAFCAKPAVRSRVNAQIDIPRLDAVASTWLT